MHRFGLFIVLLALVIGTTGQASDVPTGMGFVAHIDQAVSEGRLSSEDGLLYKFYYGFDQDRLPTAYRPELFVPLKNGTAIVREYQSRRDELSRRMRETIDPYLAHADPSEGRAKATYDSPSGRFRLTYETSGTHTVPTTDVDPANGIPDFVEKIATYLDNCWFVEITENDFAPPPNSPYPVTFENMQLYGYTQGLGGLATEIVLHHTYLNFPPNDDPEGNRWGAAKVTCAHEFKHASQGAQTAFPIPGWAELDAVWCEELVYDYVNDYFNYLTGESPIYQPAIPLDNGGLGSYEDCVWQIWMAETHATRSSRTCGSGGTTTSART